MKPILFEKSSFGDRFYFSKDGDGQDLSGNYYSCQDFEVFRRRLMDLLRAERIVSMEHDYVTQKSIQDTLTEELLYVNKTPDKERKGQKG